MISSSLEYKIKPLAIPATLLALLFLTTGKDLFHSFIKDYHFYWSDSLLFGSFWWLFIPLILLSKRTINYSPPKFSPFWAVLLSLLHILIFSFLVFSISALFFTHTFGFARVFTDTVADNGISCLLIYGVVNLLFTKSQKTTLREDKAKIRVRHRNAVVFLECKDILYVKTERPYIALVTHDRTYLRNDTLKDFLKEHLSPNFVRIHKSAVVNTDFITSFKSRKNGDYDLLMVNNSTLRASRNYSSCFRPAPKTSG